MAYFYRITDINDKWYKALTGIYSVSFPVYEQRDELQQIKAIGDSRYHLLVTIKNENLLGFIAYWDFDTYVYIEHLAVNPAFRGESIGTTMLKTFDDVVKKQVLLEIDPVEDEVSEKRLRFYERLGYKKNPYTHTHPPYDSSFEPHKLIVLSLGRELSEDEYNLFYNDLANVVMKDNS